MHAARPDRLCPRPRHRRDRRARLRAVPARRRRHRCDLRARRRPFRQAARRPGDGLRRVRPARLSRRHAPVEDCAIAASKPLRLRVAPFFDMALDEGPNESLGKLKSETVGATLLFENRQQQFPARRRFRRRPACPTPSTETARARFFGGAGPRHPYARAGRDRPQPTLRSATTAAASPPSQPTSSLRRTKRRSIALVLGEAPDRAQALEAASAAEVARRRA